MPKFKVIGNESNGLIEIVGSDSTKELRDDQRELGEFHAENMNEAWRQLITLNVDPAINEQHKVVVDTSGANTEAAQKKAEFEAKVMKEAVGKIEVPEDTGAPDAEEEEVDEEQDVEEDDPTHPGKKRTVKKKTGRKIKVKKPKPAPQPKKVGVGR